MNVDETRPEQNSSKGDKTLKRGFRQPKVVDVNSTTLWRSAVAGGGTRFVLFWECSGWRSRRSSRVTWCLGRIKARSEYLGKSSYRLGSERATACRSRMLMSSGRCDREITPYKWVASGRGEVGGDPGVSRQNVGNALPFPCAKGPSAPTCSPLAVCLFRGGPNMKKPSNPSTGARLLRVPLTR